MKNIALLLLALWTAGCTSTGFECNITSTVVDGELVDETGGCANW